MDRSRRTTWLVVLGCWTVIGLAYSSHLYVYHNILDGPTTWRLQLAEAFADFYVWAALTPAVLALSRRFPLRAGAWPRSALVHVPASLLVSLAQVAGHTVADMGFIHGHFAPANLWEGFTALFARTYHFGLLVYWGIVAVHQAVAHFREQELRASRLEAELARAELQALRRQLHPHFLFNTLNAISALMHRDVKAADLMLARLSEFLRTAIESDGAQEVALGRELELLERYLEIEKVRFRDRLTVRMDVAADALGARVPSLVLQPLVENAIRHGIGNRRGPGVLEVRAARDNGSLLLSVRDNGGGMGESAVEGVGLSNTRARLEQLYGTGHRFELRNIPEGGLEVNLAIPYRPAGDDEDGPDPRDHR